MRSAQKCRTTNCDEPARDGEFCWRCREEVSGEPVTIRDIVGEFPGALLLIGFIAVVGILIYGAEL